MSVNITWERNEAPVGSPVAGWRAYVDGEYVGTVYVDGDAFFGKGDARYMRYPCSVLPRSHALAAEELVRYVKAGGR